MDIVNMDNNLLCCYMRFLHSDLNWLVARRPRKCADDIMISVSDGSSMNIVEKIKQNTALIRNICVEKPSAIICYS